MKKNKKPVGTIIIFLMIQSSGVEIMNLNTNTSLSTGEYITVEMPRIELGCR